MIPNNRVPTDQGLTDVVPVLCVCVGVLSEQVLSGVLCMCGGCCAHRLRVKDTETQSERLVEK